uniref:GNAT family N-acetyltransferase n=1 Tax=Lactococcus sp. TaxID=44273 RepID=UPI003A6C9043
MTQTITILSQENALKIANEWHYDAPYDFYDMQNDIEDYEEIISPSLRQNNYYQVTNNNNLIGFFVIEPVDENKGKYEIGLGMDPSITGKGKGIDFLNLIIKFSQSKFHVTEIILDVAQFNVRAQKVYQKAGFKISKHHEQKTNGATYNFIEMTKTY